MASAHNYIQLSSLPEDVRQQVLDFIEFLMRRRQGNEPKEKRKTPVPGLAKGMVTVPADFDAPLDDFKEYME
ncbi:MAG: DUF2281 domain-containing protein [Flavobacteriales bacterium]|nr:hypothetical protein [Flavobacteriales bacterium]MCC6575853.1 DUF2281 domain-containing protein [Flavobacteriales bacterium]NUQ13840.1 DUF2281 domain-containing protein [Flavobacteriales bacterium]